MKGDFSKSKDVKGIMDKGTDVFEVYVQKDNGKMVRVEPVKEVTVM